MDVDVESGGASAIAPSAAAADTLRVAALVLLLQLTHTAAQQQQSTQQTPAAAAASAAKPAPASAAAGAAAAAASAASAAVSAISAPLQSLLSSVAAALPGSFFSRLLAAGTGQGAPRLPPGSLPPAAAAAAAADAAPQAPSYPELALRALRELAAHPTAARALAAAQPAATNAVVGLLAWLHELHAESTGTGGVVSSAKAGGKGSAAAASAQPLSESQLALVEQAVLALDRLAQGAAATPAHAEQPAPVVPLLHLQPLVSLLPLLPHAVPNAEATPLEAAAVRALAWLLPPTLAAAPASQAAIAVRHLVPPLAGLFERDQTTLKIAYLRLLVALQEAAAAAAARTQREGGMVPPPLYLLSLRQGLEAALGSKADLPVRLMALKMARMLLQQHGPVWATVPAPAPASASAAAAAAASPSAAATAARASSSSSSAAVSGPPHCRFLQVLYNISTVELRLTLMEASSARAASQQRMAGEAGRLREDALREALALLRILLAALVGDDADVPRETRPFQWWNLSGDMLMFFKGK